MGAFAETVRQKKAANYTAKLARLKERNPALTDELLNSLAKVAVDDWQARQTAQDEMFRKTAPLSADIAVTEGSKRLEAHKHMAYMLGRHMRKVRPASELETSLGYSPEEINELDASPGREVMIPMGKSAGDPVVPGSGLGVTPPQPVIAPRVPPVVKPAVTPPKQPSLGMRMSGLPPPPPPPEIPNPFNSAPVPPELGIKRGGAILDPVKHTVQDYVAELMGMIQRKKEDATKITEDPSTHPAYYPSLALGVPKAFSQGFADENKHMTGNVQHRVDADLSKAKAEFEAALSGKSDNPALAKMASVIDKFAEVSIKVASGELNQIMNGYLGLATLLGSGTFAMGHSWAKKNDKNVQTLKAVKEYMRQRAYLQPPVVLSDPGDPALAHQDEQAPVDHKALDVKFEPAKSETSDVVNAES